MCTRSLIDWKPQAFDNQPHFQLLKEMLAQAFATPKRHHKSKPFFDHVISFSIADGRIWMRNYQVQWAEGVAGGLGAAAVMLKGVGGFWEVV